MQITRVQPLGTAPTDLLAFQIDSGEEDEDKLQLRTFLRSCRAYERTRHMRGDFVHIFAASSAGVWIAAVRPEFVSPAWRAVFAGLWALLLLVVNRSCPRRVAATSRLAAADRTGR